MIVYRGASKIDVKAPVLRGAETVGVIAEVNPAERAQRVVVAVRKASNLRRNDRYLPYRAETGVGFKVVIGTGEPLRDGDVVEAGFGWRPQDEPPPEPLSAEKKRAGQDHPSAGGQPVPEAVPAAPVDLPPWKSVRPESDLQSGGIFEGARYEQVPPDLMRRPREIAVQARSMPPHEAAEYLSQESRTVAAEFDQAGEDARDRGDHLAAGQIRRLRFQTLAMMRRMQMKAAQSR